MTIKVIFEDEWWPVYGLKDASDKASWQVATDIPDELIARWKACLSEIDQIQAELRGFYEVAK